jgi:hypothetical protein
MSSAALDRLLAVLIVIQVASGLLTLRAGIPATAPLFWLHGLVGGALLVAAGEKLRRSVGPAIRRRRWGRLAMAAILALLVAAALVGGFAWVAGGRILSIGPWTVLTLHVWAALAAIPILILHLVPRRFRLLAPPRGGAPRISRRTVLSMGIVGALGALVWAGSNVLDALQGGTRRFTGSRWLPSGAIPPPTTFYGEGTPEIDPNSWRLAVTGRVEHPLSLDLDALAAIGTEDRDATLDCTSGWAMTTGWRGTPLSAVLIAAGADPRATRVVVRSVTGWSTALERHELDACLLATHVAGDGLPAANGAPCRLTVPTRRGLDWVKWVAEVEVA